MLKVAESSMKAEPKRESRCEVLMVQKGKGLKKGLGKGKGKDISNVAKPKAGSKELSKSQKTSLAESQCLYCNVKGHYRRDCPKFLEDVKSGTVANIPGIYGLKSRQLGKGEVDLRVGNGARVAALAVGSYSLILPTRRLLELNHVYYVPVCTKNIISVSVLDLEGYDFKIKDSC
ncbi:hypothetical protein CASFOL_002018 [Castilleja foliolosa]|uniref:CCHC-type domain-containing protein n=1 Tax=Castilleja foliolosa TaxID=1961234 RepID=A0ABD3EDD6_9LAMI